MRPASIASAALESTRVAATDRNIELTANYALLEARVRGDAARVQQILGILLADVIAAAPDGGRVTLHVRHGAGCIEFVIESNGAKAAPGQPGQRWHSPLQTGAGPGRGTGLSLTLAREIAALHGGELRSGGTSAGARFTLSLPAAAAESAAGA
jgi:signal transduction histidine kinase